MFTLMLWQLLLRVIGCGFGQTLVADVRCAPARLLPCDGAGRLLPQSVERALAQAWNVAVGQELDPKLMGPTFNATVSAFTAVQKRDLSTAGMVEGYGLPVNGYASVTKHKVVWHATDSNNFEAAACMPLYGMSRCPGCSGGVFSTFDGSICSVNPQFAVFWMHDIIHEIWKRQQGSDLACLRFRMIT